MISLLITLLVLLLVAAIVFWIVSILPLPAVPKQIAYAIVAVLFLVIVLRMLGFV